MFRTISRFVTSIALLALAALWRGSALPATGSSGEKLSHPIHGHQASPNIKYLYGPGAGRPADWNRGDISFPPVGGYPPVTDLTEEEKYIIAGSVNSAWSADTGLCDWATTIQSITAQFYEQYGSIPDRLDDKAIRSIEGLQGLGDKNLCQFLNPLTDEWPRLKAENPAPGDVYIRPLTSEEMRYYAERSPMYRQSWFGGKLRDPRSGEELPAQLDGKVYYIRIYGWHDVIYASFLYTLR